VRILVTGGAGFIGSHLVDRLVEMGHEVVVVDNLSTGRREYVNNGASLAVRDIKDPGWGEGIGAVDAVFHFAANPEVRVSTTEPRVHFDENVLATFNVLEWARRGGARAVVFRLLVDGLRRGGGSADARGRPNGPHIRLRRG
jgi:UDP-glucose 4-epimerase